jgi:hypothetical protein
VCQAYIDRGQSEKCTNVGNIQVDLGFPWIVEHPFILDPSSDGGIGGGSAPRAHPRKTH